MSTIVVSELPANVKRWFENWLKRELRPTDTIMAIASTPIESKEFHEQYEEEKKVRRDRLEAMAQKMREAGMSEDVVYCALHDGLQKGETPFFLRSKGKKEKQTHRTSALPQ